MLNNISIYNNNILKIIITLIINAIYILFIYYYLYIIFLHILLFEKKSKKTI